MNRFSLLLASLILSFSYILLAQDSIKETVHVDLVDIYLTATDKNGNFITDLRKEEIAVKEDGVPQAITNFGSIRGEMNEVPLNLALMIDNSGSMVEEIEGLLKIDLARESGLMVSRELGPYDRMMIISFDEDPKITPLTGDRVILEKSISGVRVHFGHTALFRSISSTLDELNRQPGRKVLLLISDGKDNLSDMKIEEVIQKLVNAPELTVVILGTVASDVPGVAYNRINVDDKGKKTLQRMAESSAGFAFFPKNLKDVKKVQDLIRSFVRSQYSLAYRPVNRKFDGKWRKIEITCSRKNVQLHYRKGYYDTPESSTELH